MHHKLLVKVLFLCFFSIQTSLVYGIVLHRLYITSNNEDGCRYLAGAFKIVEESPGYPDILKRTSRKVKVEDYDIIPSLLHSENKSRNYFLSSV